MTLTIQEVIRLEKIVRGAKDKGTSSNMTLKIAEVERLLNFAKEKIGVEQIEKEKKADNLIQFKPETFRTRTFKTWQDDSEKLRRERVRKTAAEKRRRARRSAEKTRLAWKTYAGSLSEHKKRFA